MNDPLLELTPGPTLPVAAPILTARAGLLAAIDDLLVVPDAALELVWEWRPGFLDNTDVRYGFYRIHERLEEAAAAIVHGRAAAGEGPGIGPAVALLGPATAARWELRAAIAPLQTQDLDADPGGGEWTVRRTLGHTVGGQRSYGWYSAWWLDRGHAPGPLPERPGDARMPAEPDEDDEAIGSPAEILARLDELVDNAMGRFAGLTEDELSIPARWSGLPVDLRFRIGRWGSHIREHTVQVDKTLAMTGRPATEVERLVRLIGASYGRLEGLVVARSDAVLNRPWPHGGSAALVLESCADEVRALAASVGVAAAAVG
ncbi:MAG: DinB family protein [Candidatus Limnocylindrales bacterium]